MLMLWENFKILKSCGEMYMLWQNFNFSRGSTQFNIIFKNCNGFWQNRQFNLVEIWRIVFFLAHCGIFNVRYCEIILRKCWHDFCCRHEMYFINVKLWNVKDNFADLLKFYFLLLPGLEWLPASVGRGWLWGDQCTQVKSLPNT